LRSHIEKWMRKENVWLFSPLAALWALAVWLRHKLYCLGICKSKSVRPLVISVGSIAVGGVGKTPLVMKLIEELSLYKGTLLTRGYRGADEAIMVKRKYPFMEVAIGKNRLKKAIEHQEKDFLIMDDGWQQRKLKADVAIAVLSDDVLSSKYIPQGRLRDMPIRLKEADLVVITHPKDGKEKEKWKEKIHYYTDAPVVFAEYKFSKIIWLNQEVDLQAGDEVACFCGIGSPHFFLELIEKSGYKIVTSLILGDHDAPSYEELENLAKQVKAILCTEKDFVKLEKSSFPIGMIEVKYCVIDGCDSFHTSIIKIKKEIERRRA